MNGKYNNFYQQESLLDSNGMYKVPAASLTGAIQCINYDPLTEEYLVIFDVYNRKDASASADTNLAISFYDGDPTNGAALLGIYYSNKKMYRGDSLKNLEFRFSAKNIKDVFMVVNTVRNKSGNFNDGDFIQKECDYTDFDTLPNTSIFPMNIRGEDNAKQTRLYTVRHYPVAEMARIYNKNPRWKSVPKTPTMQVPDIVNGIWGDYYLKLPNKDYMEVITMQSEVFNEYQVWLNGVQMYPIQEENGLITGYPLSKVSPDGKFITCKGDYERIPFFYFSKSNPDKNYVKEEELNEVGRLMLLMLRQKTQPSIGNNTNRVIQPNIWNPNMVISDVKKDELHILKPNDGINQSEFSFYKLLTEDIDNSSVSKSIEGQQAGDMTATQYVDQKKESLKKLGISLDRAIDFLRQIYWKILDNEISYIDQKIKEYKEDGEFTEAYQSFTLEDSIDGKKGTISVNLMDDTSDIDEYKKAQEEADSGLHTRSFYAKPAHLKSIYKRMRDKMYCNVVSLPEGEQQMLLGALFNLLTSYINLGGNAQKINFDYLETIIAENSGFDSTKVFLEEAPYAPQMDMTGENVPQNMNLKQLTAKQPIQ